MVGCIQFHVIENGEIFVPRQTHIDTVKYHFGNSRQNVGGGNTAIMQRTDDARLSNFNATIGLTKDNNASAPSFDEKRTKY